MKGRDCRSSSFCMAAGDGDAYARTASGWARGVVVQDTQTLTAVSCPSADFCLAVDNAGNAYSYSLP